MIGERMREREAEKVGRRSSSVYVAAAP